MADPDVLNRLFDAIGGTDGARAEDVGERINELLQDPDLREAIIQGFAFTLGMYASLRRRHGAERGEPPASDPAK